MIQLRAYQNEVVNNVISFDTLNYPSGLVIMPAGSGKTVISAYIFKKLHDKRKLNNMAYVSPYQVEKHSIVEVINQIDPSLKNIIECHTVTELHRLIKENKVYENQYEYIIFDNIDEYDRKTNKNKDTVKEVFDYFSCFKLGLSRNKLNELSLFKKELFEYNFEQAVDDGYFKILNNDIFNEFENKINLISYGDIWEKSLKDLLLNELKKENIEYKKALEKFISNKIDISEIEEIKHRKEQLIEFKKLLEDKLYFEKKAKKQKGTESVWQNFFELNPWIFGVGLNFVFNAPLNRKKLEQIVSGHSVVGKGKRIDALLKSTGLIQTLCFGEIKTHQTNILKNVKTSYRPESWAIPDELAGGISQLHRTVQKSLYSIKENLPTYDKDGFKQNESIYLYKPKSFLIIGTLEEFKNENGNIHEDKFSSFELFRRSITDIEIITFDELYAKADSIVNTKWNKNINA